MDSDIYQDLAMRTKNSSLIWERRLDNAALGLAGEAGEFANDVKKFLYHGHDASTPTFVDELGDILWYVAMAADVIGVSLSVIMQANIDKLKKRYPDGFSHEASINRKVA